MLLHQAGGVTVEAGKTYTTTPHDNLPVPGGGKFGDLHPNEVRRRFADRIEGMAHENGHLANAAAYAANYERIGDEGRRLAQARWLAEWKD